MREVKEDMMNTEVSTGLTTTLTVSVPSTAESPTSMNLSYNEMADVTVQIIDPVEQVEKNLAHLQELQNRMKFMMREIRYLMKI